MEPIKVSICITVLNEGKSISSLLDSLLAQSTKPTEIVIVDGGSSDNTAQIIRHYQKKDKRIRFVVEPGSVAHGRNAAVELSRFPIITQIDAGCVARKDWLQKLITPFKHKEVDVVAGFYYMSAKTSLQKAMNVYHGVPPERFDATSFLPSASSVAFRKKVWEVVGGYSEKLNKAGEDTLFIYEVINKGFDIVRVKEAIVDWQETADFSLSDSLKKFYQYANGDAQAGIWWHPKKQLATHNIKVTAIFIRYFIGITLLILSVKQTALLLPLVLLVLLYLVWPIIKWRDVIYDFGARLWLPLVQLSSDLAVMAGFISGIFSR